MGLTEFIDTEAILKETVKNLYDGVPVDEVFKSAILAARALVEKDPAYSQVTARLLLHTIRKEVLGEEVSQADMAQRYAEYFPAFIQRGIEAGLLDAKLAEFDLPRVARALDANRDLQFGYLGLQTLYDRYFLHVRGTRIELPQVFFMRVAMGLALRETDREARAIEFYEILSSFDFMSSTPTLFNSGTLHSQLSSCYLTTVSDDLEGIYDAIKENALLAKYAGGLGNDWTPVRALRSHIKAPMAKAGRRALPEGGQRHRRGGQPGRQAQGRGLHLSRNLAPGHRRVPGAAQEHRRRAPPHPRHEHGELDSRPVHEARDGKRRMDAVLALRLPGPARQVRPRVRARLPGYEAKVASGELKLFKKMPAISLWRKMLSMLFETGHPWITFKDPCNIRSPQQHVGVVHSSNLCTEITLNTNESEIAVCNLGSVNLVAHMKPTANGGFELDHDKIKRTVGIAMRMLDNVIDINYYAVEKARNSNMRHRPVGMGIMGFQDCLHMMRVPYASQAAIEFADRSMEAVCYQAYWASSELAQERGRYQSYEGSLWSRGILPQDSIAMLRDERGGNVDVDESSSLDWNTLRARIKEHGMRNSNCIAIAPTATISNIIGVSACIEPTFQNLYVKSNLSGEFTVVNDYLVRDLKKLGLWDEVMVADLKYFDGSLSRIDRVPTELRELYATAFEVEPSWLVECAARRQKWIDQAQSLNIYMAGASGKKLDDTYKLAWQRGLKTTYYLRTMGATSAEKSTGRGGELNAVSAGNHNATAPVAAAPVLPEPEIVGAVCTMRPGDPGFEECEACQ